MSRDFPIAYRLCVTLVLLSNDDVGQKSNQED